MVTSNFERSPVHGLLLLSMNNVNKFNYDYGTAAAHVHVHVHRVNCAIYNSYIGRNNRGNVHRHH
eukprot:m.144647 g.144647  ORF g.144647 m.144647 type:complete len:65 (+) comp30386_c0_seq2:154-348(+)